MEIGHLIPHIEALIFASDKPLTAMELTELINNAFGFMEDKIVLDQVESALEGIVEKYRSEFYPFEVRESGGGWQFLTKRDYHKTVAQLNGDKFLKRLSTAALEALSIVAYKQPVTKAEIEAIRGVSSDYAIQKLLEKELIVITGRNEKMPGHPLVYGTSKNFMDYFGINSAEDLPKLKEVFDDAMVNATNVNDAIAEQESREEAGNVDGDKEAESPVLVVAENGELIEGVTGITGGHINGEAVEFTAAGETEETGEGTTGTTTDTGEDTTIEDSAEEERTGEVEDGGGDEDEEGGEEEDDEVFEDDEEAEDDEEEAGEEEASDEEDGDEEEEDEDDEKGDEDDEDAEEDEEDEEDKRK